MACDLWSTCILVPGLTRAECAAWVQAWGSILAVLAALSVVVWQHHLAVRRERNNARVAQRGHLDAIEAEIGHCAMQCAEYLQNWNGARLAETYHAPAYRLPTIAYAHSLPPLVREASLTPGEFGALVQFYVDALSFNRCLDNLERMEIDAQGKADGAQLAMLKNESRRAATKALHVVSQSSPIRSDCPEDMGELPSRLESALAVITKHRDALKGAEVTPP